MIDYIKEYGVTDLDFEYIMNNINPDLTENMVLSELNIRETLSFYNKIGITEDIAKLLIARPDLIVIPEKDLEELLTNIDIDIFKNIVNKSIEDLILLGI